MKTIAFKREALRGLEYWVCYLYEDEKNPVELLRALSLPVAQMRLRERLYNIKMKKYEEEIEFKQANHG